MFRLAVGRIAAPQFKVVAHHRNIISFGKIAKAFPKYFPTSQNLSAPPAEEAVNAQKLNAFQADKFGLLNLVPSNSANIEENNFGDFQGVNPSTFVHALRIPKQDVDFAEFTISDVETINSEPLSNSDLFTVKLQAKRVKGREGRPLERTYHRIKNITQNLRVVNVEDVFKQIRRSNMGTPLLLAQ